MEKDSGTGKKIMGITAVLLIPILILVLLTTSIFIVFHGVVTTITNEISESKTGEKFKSWISSAKTVKGFNVQIVYKDKLETLRETIESEGGLNTQISGLTEVRLRKIVLANLITTSFSDTLCAAEVTEKEILEAVNEREKQYGRKFDSVEDFQDFCANNAKARLSTWSGSLSDPIVNYMCYYETDVFFYFKDTNEQFGDKDKWYIGAMGATTITTEKGAELEQYNSLGDFEGLLASYNEEVKNLLYKDGKRRNNVKIKDVLELSSFKDMKKAFYNVTGENKIKVYKFKMDLKQYDYLFENENIDNIEMVGLDQKNVYSPTDITAIEEEIDLKEKIDMSQYAIPIELMIDMLNITGSGDFVEEFIDYAVENTSAKVMAYATTTETYTYDKTTYNINDDFIFEMYDMRDLGSLSLDQYSFKAYKDIIFNRKYNGNSIDRVTSIPNFESIDYSGMPNGDGSAYGEFMGSLHSHLKNAYNPSSDFSLGSINVTENVTTVSSETSWDVVPLQISTWYGDIAYSGAEKKTTYTISDSPNEVTETEFENYDFKKITNGTQAAGESKEIRYISNTLVESVGGESVLDLDGIDYTAIDSEDIYDDAMETLPGADNKTHYWNWTMKGLSYIAVKDKGKNSEGNDAYNDDLGGGKGSDYIYCKYTKNNVKNYDKDGKKSEEIIDRSNIKMETSNINAKLMGFLAILKNETGERDGGPFKKDGKVVYYGDIYDGQSAAGDLLLDNGAITMFELLEASDNTQNLVNVFKYLAYLYSGMEYYGITRESQLGYIFNLSGTTGFYGNSVEEKIWFALRNAGFSEVAVAGAMGNIYQECRFDPELIESNGEGIRINTVVIW